MKKKLLQKTGSLVCALSLMFSLSGHAFAETGELPSEAPTLIPQPAQDPVEEPEEELEDLENKEEPEEKAESEDEEDESEDEEGESEDEEDESEDEEDESEDEEDESEDEEDESDANESMDRKSGEAKSGGNGDKVLFRMSSRQIVDLQTTDNSTTGASDTDGDTQPAALRTTGGTSTDASDTDGDAQQPDDGKGKTAGDRLLVVGDQELDFSETVSGEHWRYDADDGSLVLIGYEGETIGTAGSGLTIKAAGVNRVEKLIVDGNINLIGTGILLVDSMELPDNAELKLQTDTSIYDDGTGSVAVFLKQTRTVPDGNGNEVQEEYYLLVNKNVAGLLDEKYELPAGVTLVVPDGGTLLMQSLIVGEYLDPKDGKMKVRYSTKGQNALQDDLQEEYGISIDARIDDSTAPELTIPELTTLIIESVENAGRLLMNSVSLISGKSLSPKLNVAGSLKLSGTVTGGLAEISNKGDVSGNGSFSGTSLSVAGGRSEGISSLNVDNSLIRLQGAHADIESLGVAGSNTLLIGGDSAIGTLSVEKDGSLNCCDTSLYPDENKLTFTQGISGEGALWLQSGIYVLEKDCSLSGVALTNDATIFDYSETGQANLTPNRTPRIETRESSGISADRTSIPVVMTFCSYGYQTIDYYYTRTLKEEENQQIPDYIPGTGSSPDDMLNYEVLSDYWDSTCAENSYYQNTYGAGSNRQPVIVVETETNGRWDTIELKPGKTGASVRMGDVKMIRVLTSIGQLLGGGGGTSTTTITTQTGSGRLGQNAGSIVGGSGSGVFTGGGITHPISRKENDSGSGDTNGNAGGSDSQNGTENREELRIWTDPVKTEPGVYTLRAARGENPLEALREKVTVRMDYTPTPEQAGNKLYVVFRLPGNKLQAYAAQYDAIQKKLVFDTELLGEFVVIAFESKYEEFSPEFYEELAKVEEVGKLF